MKMNQKRIQILWYISIFLFMFIWFTNIHPLVVHDADDWGHIAYARSAIPDLDKWNPAKLLPELLMSFVSSIAAYVVYPISGDYIGSIMVMSAVTIALFIVIYIYSVGQLIKRIFCTDTKTTICVETLFFILHFLIFRYGDVNNTYLFHCEDLTCYYNYLVPALLNASLVSWMIKNEDFNCFLKSGDLIKRGLFFTVVYFAIFSNLIDSVILVGYVGVVLLSDAMKLVKNQEAWKIFLKSHLFHFAVLLCWGVSAVFELLGGRAALSGEGASSYVQLILQTITIMLSLVSKMHKMFLLFSLAVIVLTIIIFVGERKQEKQDIIKVVLLIATLIVLMAVYALLITAKVHPNYISRSEYLFGVCFYSLMLITICIGYITNKVEKIKMLIPLVACILLSFVNTNLKTFKDSNQFGVSGKLCLEISRDMVDKVIEADQNGITELSLEVSNSGGVNNWPQSMAMEESMSTALYKHGITSRKIKITFVPSDEYNAKYKIFQ